MDIKRCKTCEYFGTMYVTGDTRKYPRCRKNKNKATWDVTENECEYKERNGIKPLALPPNDNERILKEIEEWFEDEE